MDDDRQKYAHTDEQGFVLAFYDVGIHGANIPDGAVPITTAAWVALLDGQANGSRMKVSADGTPELVDHPPPADDVLAAQARAQRDALLRQTDWIITQQQEKNLTGAGGMSEERFRAFAEYRQALRDVPQQAQFPGSIEWPEEPAA